MKSRYFLAITILFLAVFLNSNCSQNTAVEATSIDPEEILTPTPQIIKAPAKITNEKAKGLKVTETFLTSKENLSKVYFVDDKNGWLAGNVSVGQFDNLLAKSIYNTNNGGKTWQKVTVPFPKDAYIQDLFFINKSVGWIQLQTDAECWEGGKMQSWILKTMDGGKTWHSIFNQEDKSHYKKIIFVSETEGWMIGTKSPTGCVYEKGLLYKTKDGGKTWNNLADRVVNQTKQKWFSDILVENSQKIIVSTASEFFRTEDGGKTWTKFNADFYDDFLKIVIAGTEEFIGSIGKLTENRLRIADGRRNDIEGSSSYLAIQQNDESWILRRFSGEAFCLSILRTELREDSGVIS